MLPDVSMRSSKDSWRRKIGAKLGEDWKQFKKKIIFVIKN